MFKLADYSDVVTVDQLDAALRAGAFDGVFHYIHGTPGYVRRVEDMAIVDGIRARGWLQAGIDLPRTPGDVDGNALASVANWYGFPKRARMMLDIEPSQFAAFSGWDVAADNWCNNVRAGGYSPITYGTDETLAACSNHADAIVRAVPGLANPDGPGLNPNFMPGARAVQFTQVTLNGINFDVSNSEFSLGGPSMFGMAQWEEPALIMAFQLIQTMFFGVIDPTGQVPFINAIRSGVTVNSIMDGWRTLPQAIAFQTAVSNLVATENTVAHLGNVNNPAVAAALKQLSTDSQQIVTDLQALATAAGS